MSEQQKSKRELIIDRVADLIVAQVGDKALRNAMGVPGTNGDIFGAMIAKNMATSREDAIQKAAVRYKSMSDDGKWGEIAKWSVEYEDNARIPSVFK